MSHASKFLTLALVLGAVSSVYAASQYLEIAGNSCSAVAGSVPVYQTRYGLYNPSIASAATVVCPLQLPIAKWTYGYIGFAAYHRNPNDVSSCTLSMGNDDGSAYTTAYASLANPTSPRQYASRYTNPTTPSEVVWINCRIPAAYSGSYSYLNSLVVTVSN
jgi:hypothetical protein